MRGHRNRQGRLEWFTRRLGVAMVAALLVVLGGALPASATTTSISLATSGSPSLTGASVTYTAMVSPSPPDGETVAFSDGGSTISACAAQMLSSGVATCAVTYSSTGSHSITASYGGDGTLMRRARRTR